VTVYDYAWDRPTGAELTAAGAEGVIRYLSHDPTKDLTAAELADLTAHGIPVALVWETTTQRALDGRQAGVSDAHDALAKRRALNLPDTMPVYFAVDFDITQQQAGASCVNGYLSGARDTMGRGHNGESLAGVYGGWTMMDAAHMYGHYYLWQTDAWSGGREHDMIDLYQDGGTTSISGHTADTNQIISSNWGQNTYQHTPAPVWPGRYIHTGDTGEDVRTWQTRMGQRGWTLTADGIYGPISTKVCKLFQTEKGLQVDGIVGPITWNATWTAPITP
jgi:hypothetical protein